MTNAQKIQKEKPYLKAMRDMGITVTSEFVPYSKSRNFKPGAKLTDKGLNWKVTLLRNGKEVITTDYGAGIGHCPSHKLQVRYGGMTIYEANRINTECEKGFACAENSEYTIDRNRPIEPQAESVVYSLLLDSDVLNHDSFESWASEFGYDQDSRKGEKLYQACLGIALKIKRYFTDAELETLREAFSGY